MPDSSKLKVTPEQEYCLEKHSRMVGRILDLLEAAFPEGTQLTTIKKLAQIPLYDYRNEMIKLVTTGVPSEVRD